MKKYFQAAEDVLDLTQNLVLTLGFAAFSDEFESDANTAVKILVLGMLLILQPVQFTLQKYKPKRMPEQTAGSVMHSNAQMEMREGSFVKRVAGSAGSDSDEKSPHADDEQDGSYLAVSNHSADDGVDIEVVSEHGEQSIADAKPTSSFEDLMRLYFPVAKAGAVLTAFASDIAKSYSEKVSVSLLYTSFGSFAILLGVKGILTMKNGFPSGFFLLSAGLMNGLAILGIALHKPDAIKYPMLAGSGCCFLLTINSAKKLRRTLQAGPADSTPGARMTYGAIQ